MKKVVKSVVQDDVRSKNFLIYGAPAGGGGGTAHNVAEEAINVIWNEALFHRPDIVAASRIGNKELSNGKPTPIKVTLASMESVRMVLARASNLKKSASSCYHTWCISPDRNRIRREQHIQNLLIN